MGRKENRRRPRLETRQPASALAKGDALACEIRNFCRLGLYLAFADPAESGQPSPGWPVGEIVEVMFTADVDGRPQMFRLLGSVAHASAAGAGLMVPSMPPQALVALQAAALAATVAPAEPPAEERAASDPLSRCRQLVAEALDTVLGGFFAGLDEACQAAAQKTAGVQDKQHLRQVPAVLRADRHGIGQRLAASVQGGLVARAPGKSASAAAEGESGLALLDEAEFEDWLNLAAVINRLETDGGFATVLAKTESPLAERIGRPVDRQTNPLGATAIGRAFQDAIRELPLAGPARAVAYQAFGAAMERPWRELAPKLVDVLTPAESGPEGPADGTACAQDPANTTSATAGVADDADEPEGTAAEVEAAAPSGAAASAAYSLDGALAGLSPAGADPGGAGSAGVAPAGGSGPSLLSVAQGLASAAGGAAAGAAAPSAAGPMVSLADLARLLDAAPAAGWAEAPGGGRLSLSERLAQAAGGMNIPAPMRRALDGAGDVLGKALAVSGGGQGIDGLLKRMEQPLLKLSVREGGFPASADHPARQVVDLLEQYAVAVDDEGQFFDAKLQRFLNLTVERIHRQADQDDTVFRSARDSLARLLRPLQQTRQSRVEHLQEACESRQRARNAKHRVREVLDARLAGQPVPAVLPALLQAGWRQALVLQALRGGTDDGAWVEAVALLDEVWWLLTPASAQAPGRKGAQRAVLARLDPLLAGVNPVQAAREASLAELESALAAVAAGSALPMTTVDSLVPEAAAAAAGLDEAAVALSRRLRVGDWWQVQRGEAWVPMQLVWCSEPAGECAFTNRSATQKLEIALADLAARLAEGTVREGVDQAQPLLERSVQALLDDSQGQMLDRAQRDPVTGLLSRKGFLQRLLQTAWQRQEDHTHLVVIIEFDQFRVVYQACGVSQGEALARALAAEVKASLDQHGVMASFRDDTLALLLPDCRRDEGLARLERLLEHLGDFRYQPEGHSWSIGANIGVAEYQPGLESPDIAVQHADMACVAAKSLGRNRLQCYAADDRQLRSQRDLLTWAGRIDSLLGGSGLFLRAQKVAPLGNQAGVGHYHEVLLGVELTPGQPVGPLPFILAVEGLRRAHEVDLWVIRQVFDWMRRHPETLEELGGFSVNLSAMSLAHPGVIELLRAELLAGDIPTERLIFEITETAAIESYAAAGDFIRQMRRYGCRLSLDDFGSGHTSYAHLKNLRADVLKIDGSFVKDIVDSPDDYAIVKSMNDIAHSLGMHTVAEFVESPAILAKLREIGVDYAQGYAIHKPCRLADFQPVPAAAAAPAPATSVLDEVRPEVPGLRVSDPGATSLEASRIETTSIEVPDLEGPSIDVPSLEVLSRAGPSPASTRLEFPRLEVPETPSAAQQEAEEPQGALPA